MTRLLAALGRAGKCNGDRKNKGSDSNNNQRQQQQQRLRRYDEGLRGFERTGNSNGNSDRRSFDSVTRKVRELLRSG
jgi:hypothetical protein